MMILASIIALGLPSIIALGLPSTKALGIPSTRRAFAVATVASCLPQLALADTLTIGGGVQRVEEIGLGFDLKQPPPLKSPAVIYPSSVVGLWEVERVVSSIEGDRGQAEVALKTLGSPADNDILSGKKSERYQTQFLLNAGEEGTTSDIQFELSTRLPPSSNPTYDPTSNTATYNKFVALTVVQRSIEPPSDAGFGSNELVRAITPPFTRAIRVRRRFRRSFDDDNNRVIDGLELVYTYRVMDDIAGEKPTSTTKSIIRLTRPM